MAFSPALWKTKHCCLPIHSPVPRASKWLRQSCHLLKGMKEDGVASVFPSFHRKVLVPSSQHPPFLMHRQVFPFPFVLCLWLLGKYVWFKGGVEFEESKKKKEQKPHPLYLKLFYTIDAAVLGLPLPGTPDICPPLLEASPFQELCFSW